MYSERMRPIRRRLVLELDLVKNKIEVRERKKMLKVLGV